jgi:YD repeat-containing protein
VNKRYDYLNRLTSIASAPSGAAALSYSYGYNDANQRVQANLADGTFWVYEYDSLGQVRSGKRYWNDWTPVAGQQFEYGFDVERAHRITHGYKRTRARQSQELELYTFVGNDPVGKIDLVGYSWLDYIPFIGTVRCCMPQKGETIKDYAGVTVDLNKCKDDQDLAEQECASAINGLAIGYVRAALPGAAKTAIDAALAFVGLLPGGQIPSGLLVADGVIGVACLLDTLGDIYTSKNAAISAQCSCP